MSKQVGLIKLEGNIGGISFYKADGQYLARVANGPSKEQIDTQPNFKRTRENNKEFGGSANVSKAMRLALASSVQTMGDSRITSRMTKLFRAICSKDTNGVRGQRAITLSTNTSNLVNFQFNKNLSIGTVFNAPFTFSNTASRDEAEIEVAKFMPSTYINAPTGATHFKLIHALGVVSDYEYNSGTQAYEAVAPSLNSLGAIASTAVTSLTPTATLNFTIATALPGSPTMTNDVVVLQCLGIEFYQRIGTTDYILAQGNAMKIVNVF